MLLRVLIIEDDAPFRGIVSEHLRNQGHEVLMAWSVEGARKQLQMERPDVVLLDMVIADDEKAGLEIARDIPRGVPIIVMSGYDESSTRAEASRNVLAGVVCWLTKPFRLDELYDLLATVPGNS